MLFRFFKIFLAIVFSFLVIFLVFFTFFINENKDLSDNGSIFTSIDTNIYELVGSGSKNIDIGEEKYKIGTFYQQIDEIDSLYFTNIDSFKFEKTEELLTFDLQKGKFVLDLGDITKDYKIKTDGFDLDMIGVGKIYIDTTLGKNIIFSLDSTSKLKFKNIKNGEEINSLYLFPHNFIRFIPERNTELYNSDIFRIKTKISNGYFKYKLTNTSKLIKILKEDGMSFFNKVYSFVKKNKTLNLIRYNNLNSLQETSSPGADYVEKHFNYLINNSKKIVFYKNRIFKNLVILFHSTTLDESNTKKILKDLSKLEKINKIEYDYMLSIVRGFYSSIVKKNNLDNQSSLYNFAKLIINIDNYSNKIGTYKKNFTYLKYIYSYYSSKDINYINNYFKKFVASFYNDLDISNNKIIFNKETDKAFMESFLFYMEDFINSSLFAETNKGLGNINFILKRYLILSNTIYFSNGSSGVLKTGLIKNKDILVLINNFIFDNLLNKPANSGDLLSVKKGGNKFSEKDILDLKENILFINKLHLDHLSILSEKKDRILSKFYLRSQENFKEYFLALLDYNRYSREYDSSQKGLIDHINDSLDKKEVIYKKTDVIKYLSGFNYVNSGNITLSKTDEINKFRVENFLVKGNNMSFYIDFNNYKNIDNIFINGKEQYSSYPLDDLEEYWKEVYEANSGEDKEKYNFKNFFTQVFFNKKVETNLVTIDDTKEIVESKAVSAFKKQILSSDGELGSLKGILDIEYSNLIVKNLMDIYVKKATLYTSSSYNGDTQKYTSDFTGFYNLEDNNKSYFGGTKPIKLTVYDSLGGDKKTLFGGTNLNILGNIIVSDFEKTLSKITSSFSNISRLYSIIKNKFNTSSININYFIENNEIIFKLENNGKIINIILLQNKVISIKSGIIEYIQSPLDYNLINDILNKIN